MRLCPTLFSDWIPRLTITAHIGILKLPTPPATDPAHEGYQPSGINEGLIYGGLFVEDNSQNGVSLTPW